MIDNSIFEYLQNNGRTKGVWTNEDNNLHNRFIFSFNFSLNHAFLK